MSRNYSGSNPHAECVMKPNLFSKQDFLDQGFIFEPNTPDDPNPTYYGWMILGNMKIRWFHPVLADEMNKYWDFWAYGFNGKSKIDTSEIYKMSSVLEIKEWCKSKEERV